MGGQAGQFAVEIRLHVGRNDLFLDLVVGRADHGSAARGVVVAAGQALGKGHRATDKGHTAQRNRRGTGGQRIARRRRIPGQVSVEAAA